MRRIVFAVLAVTTLMINGCATKELIVVHEDAPSWVEQTLGKSGTRYWFTDQYAYGVGIAPPMNNRYLQKTAAENRARNTLVEGLRVNKVISGIVEIRGTWKDPDTNKVYALARTPIKIIPAER